VVAFLTLLIKLRHRSPYQWDSSMFSGFFNIFRFLGFLFLGFFFSIQADTRDTV
jgi:hypothetical protein